MRTTSIILISLVSIMVLAIPAQAWVTEPTEETGYYYAYDDAEEGPPFEYPELPEMPDYDSIWQDPDAEKFCSYGDNPYVYTMVDSFWYFGVWYVPGDYLYLTQDGWVSFDNTSEEGFPDPPIDDPPFPVTDDPNELIAPLWQDHDCTRDPGPTDSNRVYYLYDTANQILTVQWYQMEEHTSGNWYDFEVVLQMGGQELLEVDGCGVLYSGHLIHFLYNTTSHGWGADNIHSPPAVGFEDQDGTHGIYYQGDLVDGRVIRMGYRKAFDHNAAAVEIIAPAALVEPNTEVDPITVIGNYGNYAESFDVTLNIYDDEETSVYHNVMTLNEMNVGVDTLGPSEWPLWTPGDSGEHYVAELITSLDGDQCPANDTLRKDVKVIDHNAAAVEIITPAAFVEPNTEVDPITVIGNYGDSAESFDVTLNIYDDEETIVYHNVMTLNEMDVGVDTLGPSEWPLWTPGDSGEHYVAELITSLDGDQCPANDTLIKDIWTSAGVTETPPSSGFELKVNDMQTIEFSVPYRAKTEIAIYDLNGSKVRTLADRTYPLGTHTLTWDGCDAKGHKIAQGVYLVRMEAGKWKATRKVVVY